MINKTLLSSDPASVSRNSCVDAAFLAAVVSVAHDAIDAQRLIEFPRRKEWPAGVPLEGSVGTMDCAQICSRGSQLTAEHGLGPTSASLVSWRNLG